MADWVANFEQGVFGDTDQYHQAVETVVAAEATYGAIDRFVGHSLGGGLASAASLVFDKPAITFNAAGVNPAFVAQYLSGLGQANQLIDAYRVRGEVLSSVQEVSGLFQLFPHPVAQLLGLVGPQAPDGVGTDHWLPGESSEPISRHLMPDVFYGMRQMM